MATGKFFWLWKTSTIQHSFTSSCIHFSNFESIAVTLWHTEMRRFMIENVLIGLQLHKPWSFWSSVTSASVCKTPKAMAFEIFSTFQQMTVTCLPNTKQPHHQSHTHQYFCFVWNRKFHTSTLVPCSAFRSDNEPHLLIGDTWFRCDEIFVNLSFYRSGFVHKTATESNSRGTQTRIFLW